MAEIAHQPGVTQSAESFPLLAQLLGGYFHQDFDIAGDTLEEIIAICREDFTPDEITRFPLEISRFLSDFGPSPQTISEALQRLFRPQVILDGWEGMNAKQWLERVAELIQMHQLQSPA